MCGGVLRGQSDRIFVSVFALTSLQELTIIGIAIIGVIPHNDIR